MNVKCWFLGACLTLIIPVMNGITDQISLDASQVQSVDFTRKTDYGYAYSNQNAPEVCQYPEQE